MTESSEYIIPDLSDPVGKRQVDEEWGRIIEEVEESRELFIQILESIRNDSEVLYYEMQEVIEKQDLEQLNKVLEKLETLPFADENTTYNIFNTYKASCDYANHDLIDLGNRATLSIKAMRIRLGKGDAEVALRYFSRLAKDWPRYSLIMEDVALRSLDPVKVEKDQCRQMNTDMFYEAAKSLQESDAVDGRVNKLLIMVDDFPKLAEGEVVEGLNPGAVANGLFNIIRNACYKDVGASKVELTVAREGDELILKVENDGEKVISPEQLNSESEEYIFRSGVSSRDTTNGHKGLGLANMDKRFKLMNVDLSVVSKKDGQEAFFSNSPEVSQEEVAGAFELEPGKANTIFELRLPITKKQK